ncbi:sugar transferase [Carnobacterium maltaromaticum]|uniref:sugar transferase n=1 Tax=Carnobacterium maltaromaticum TaxID=2751 RepID=UPI0039AFDE37
MDVLEDEINLEIISGSKKRYVYRLLKRLIDIVASTVGMILLLPVFIVVAVMIKIDDPKAPIFFIQVRVGKKGKQFKMYKFRSMCVGAEEKLTELLEFNEIKGAMFKMKKDPRVTVIGKFIRQTSIDELPQLWNIFIGNMTLVGPRPPLPREVIEYSSYDKQRLVVKPGCTGLWQISGRNGLHFDEMVKLDIEYINRSSIILDIVIILRTPIAMLKSKNAY